MDAEYCETASEQRVIDNIKSDVNLHREFVMEHGYTGPIDEAHIEDIVRSLIVSIVNKRVLYLREFKHGLHYLDFPLSWTAVQMCASLCLYKINWKMLMPHTCSV